MYKERKETTYVRVGEKHIYINIKWIQVQCMSKWSQDQYTRCDVSQIERKEKNTSKPHYIP